MKKIFSDLIEDITKKSKTEEDQNEYNEYYDEYEEDYDDGLPPVGCRACGGPYPDCKDSCPIFDN